MTRMEQEVVLGLSRAFGDVILSFILRQSSRADKMEM